MNKILHLHLAELLILLIILLDASVTISGINQWVDFFSHPGLASFYEGNPFVRILLNLGLHAFIVGGLVWTGFGLYLYRKLNSFRFFAFTGFFFLHFLGYLSWFLKFHFDTFGQFLLWSFFLAAIFGFIIYANKNCSQFLDRQLVIWNE